MPKTSLELMQGTVAVLILKTLSWGSLHGYDISRSIRQRSDGALGLEDAALYQALHRLERKGWIEAEWGLSENNRRAKFYRLTGDGRQALQAEVSTWRDYVDAVSKVLETA
ncbi:MAG: PadR family transcriptional regulator, regulatory protein PadR [Acidobacteriota bacterium]|jgi:transcriptional regulator|nr:PadR family transcriptional regulator, regulatory protein PadR [Acidobacteriota bacterium]